MSEGEFKIVMTLVVTTVFWLAFMALTSRELTDEVSGYRQGFAECKAGFDSRWDKRPKD